MRRKTTNKFGRRTDREYDKSPNTGWDSREIIIMIVGKCKRKIDTQIT